MRGLRLHHPTDDSAYQPAWACDEEVYSARFPMWSAYDGHFGGESLRAEYLPERVLTLKQRRQAWLDRLQDKWSCQ